MNSVFYVRLDFGSGDFCDPGGSNDCAKIDELVKNGKGFAKKYGNNHEGTLYIRQLAL